jgi:TIR domain-containing protein
VLPSGRTETTPIKVFISHKKEDAEQARAIAEYLTVNGLFVYLDVIDAQLGKSGPDLADYIRTQMHKCTQLLAVISKQTQASWWVPWEIGVATEKERFLASFVSGGATVPEFLEKWPYLRTRADFDKYINESKRAELLVEDRIRQGYPTSARAQAFRSFHASLKASLGQP